MATGSSSFTNYRARCGKTTSRARSTISKICRPKDRKRFSTAPTRRALGRRSRPPPRRNRPSQRTNKARRLSRRALRSDLNSELGRRVALRRLLVLVEIEFDLAAMRVVEEQLPKAAAHALEGEPAQLVSDAGLLELRGGSRQVGRGKGHVVDDPGAHLVQLLPVDDMQDRLVADIQPVAGELEIRPRADLEAEEVAVELLGLFEVVAQHREVVHPLNAHAHLSFARAARLRRAQGMWTRSSLISRR